MPSSAEPKTPEPKATVNYFSMDSDMRVDSPGPGSVRQVNIGPPSEAGEEKPYDTMLTTVRFKLREKNAAVYKDSYT